MWKVVCSIILFYQKPYYWIFTACWVLLCVSEWGHSFFTRDSGKGPKNKYSTALIYIGVALLIFIGYTGYIVPSYLTYNNLAFPLFVLGVVIELTALVLRWISIYIMGGSFSRKIRVGGNQKIIKSGPFAVIRHPNYLAGLLMYLSFGFIYGTWVSLFCAILLGLLVYLYRINVEETYLRENLDGYEAYCQEVKYRLIPFIY
ncbi:MAG TPA: isoprenylcysteine carboxylmethyltransferase family protein [Balneolales bacterium]|nr:isoprenylcysteine carboxylmethyltransferase family protein [Balneolales bacterium]